MRESFKSYATKGVVSFALAGALALPLYVISKPGQSLERPTERVSGHARVVDGDTLVINGLTVRLEGIDAPELGQHCPHRWWGRWAAGRRAAESLRALVRRATVTCERHGTDAYGRMIGICTANGQVLNKEMVQRGLAWAFVKYSQRYVSAERDARARGVGIWQRACEPAWTYREARWSGGMRRAPKGCAIKGNINARGRRVYHMPWGQWYARTKIEPAKGERWFCDESEALRAGWQPSRR